MAILNPPRFLRSRSVTMSMRLGYLTGTWIVASLLVLLVFVQTVAKRDHPILFLATIAASTLADDVTRATAILAVLMAAGGGLQVRQGASGSTSAAAWRWAERRKAT